MDMTGRIFWWSFGALSLAVLATVWVLLNFDSVAYETRSAPQPEARRNPYLVAEKLLRELGYRVDTVQEAAFLDRLPAGGTLILTGDRQFHLTPSRLAALRQWVEAGGYLIADAERVGANDPILRWLDLRLQPRTAKPPKAEGADEEKDGAAKEIRRGMPEPVRQIVRVPDYGRPLRMRSNRFRPLYLGGRDADWSVKVMSEKEKVEAAELLHFSLGRGNVTILNGVRRFDNGSIADDDHGELLAALLARYQRHGDVRVMARLAVPSLWEWLGAHAQAALASATLLFAFWLWRIIPRFGVIRNETPPQRRSLIEHLRAIGVFLWRKRSLDVLLESARHNFQARLSLRQGALAALPAQELWAHLAQRTGLSSVDIGFALTGAAQRPEHFTAAMKTLRLLEQKLQ